MTRLWKKVDKILEDARKQVEDEVRKIAETIHRLKGEELRSLASRLGVKAYLTVVSHTDNPILTMPALYVEPLNPSSYEDYQQKLTHAIEELETAIGEWASDYRLAIRGLPPHGNQNLENIIATYGG